MTDAAPLVVLGGGLAAGMGEFSLHAGTQRWSFPAQLAAALGLPFSVPLIEPPGIGAPPGYAAPPVTLPLRTQTGVFEEIPPPRPTNLAVPGYRLRDAIERRPREPLIHAHDPVQTACNLILGARDFASGSGRALTQAESAAEWSPAGVLLCFGYQETLDAIVRRDPCAVPDAREWHHAYLQLLEVLGGNNGLVLFTVPNPLDTAYACSVEEAAEVCCVEASALAQLYGLRGDELVTVPGLNEIAFQIFARTCAPLSPEALLMIDFARALEERIAAVNDVVRELAAGRAAAVCDLHALFREVADRGVMAGGRRLTARYLDGFYGLNGFYPGATGHAAIANAVMDGLEAHGVVCRRIDLEGVAATDPVADYQPPRGRRWTLSELRSRTADPRVEPPLARSMAASGTGGCFPGPLPDHDAPGRLRLPAGGEQVLPILNESSYFGDGISPINADEARDAQWGSSGQYLFGGLAMVDSHLHGSVRVRFDPPEGSRSRFRLSFERGLAGDDGVLAAPQFFRMPFQNNGVTDIPGLTSHGVVDLDTGEVSDLEVYAQFHSDALSALVGLNPTFPRQPLTFPGQYGSAWLRFEPRADGQLDVTFYGTTFVPLGAGIRWPLNFHSADGRFATVPASGTAMHPHLHISTKPPAREAGDCAPALPFNAIRELTLYTHNSSFGDQFTLEIEQLGGYAKGRSHVLGRLHLQFGPRCGNSVPIAVSCLRPGGVLTDMPSSPITDVFPGRLYPGAQGFYEMLRFPTRTYALDDLAIIDDPFDIAMASIDLGTGRALNEVLHRGFIHQDLIFALLRVEPRTPKSSFMFRGPCVMENGPGRSLVYRFKGIVHLPYPPGFLFPQPDLSTAFAAGPGSALDPFLWLQAMEENPAPIPELEGGAQRVVASIGETFSYRYRVGRRPVRPVEFEYENHTQDGRFILHALTALSCTTSRSSGSADLCDTITFAGFGIWSKGGHDSLQQVAAQISTSRETPYVGIQIDLGNVSNVNTKPAVEQTALP